VDCLIGGVGLLAGSILRPSGFNNAPVDHSSEWNCDAISGC